MPPQESETDINITTDGAAGSGSDRTRLPDQTGNVKIINGDEESKAMNIKGLHTMGIIMPAIGDIAGLDGIEIHCSNLENGTFAKLAKEGEFTTATNKAAVGSAFITDWNYAKLVYVGAVTGAGNIPLSFS